MNPPDDELSLFPDLLPASPARPAPARPAETPATGHDSAHGAAVPEGEEAGSEGADEIADWKGALRRDFETWLASLDEPPEPDGEPGGGLDEAPDLYSFYEQFAAANAESRKANRRTAEAISQWSETLARFEGSLAPLRDTTEKLAAAQPKEGEMSRSHCLMLAELLDRMRRVDQAFQSPPASRRYWWNTGGHAAWRTVWEAQHQALDILVGHVEGLLRKEGVTRIDTAGLPFDPEAMVAVAAEPDAARPPQSVIEEIAAGYRRHGELLRAAQVKVARGSLDPVVTSPLHPGSLSPTP